MCGIAGIFGEGWSSSQLDSMVAVIQHRGPDDAGVFINHTRRIGLGHRRLSILDLSPAGHQPMSNNAQTIWLTFNGEIYNYLELKRELPDYPYRGDSDSEVVIAAYEKWGVDCVKHFTGMFAFAIWDTRTEKLHIFRDRLGIKPLYYTTHRDTFYFGSEVKAILAAGVPAEPDYKTWSDYLQHGYMDHSDSTFFNNISSLPPGHILTVDRDSLKIDKYWDLPEISSDILELDDDSAARKLEELLSDSLRLRLRSDVPVGVNLSGGLDSSSMMALLDDLLKDSGEMQTFTAIFNDPRYDEKDYAASISTQSKWRRNYQTLKVDEAWNMNSQMIWHQEAPYGGISTIAYHHLHAKAAENGIVVLLEGQGVDEMLAGYAYFLPHHLLDLKESGDTLTLESELAALGDRRDAILQQMNSLAETGQLNVYQDGTVHTRAGMINKDLRMLAPSIPTFPTPFSSRLQNVLYRDLRYTKLPRVLRMNDHLSMAFSHELREPFLDHHVVEFLFSLPSRMKIRNGQSKYLLRHMTKGILPDDVRTSPKRAVVSPNREWICDHWQERIQDMISSKSFKERGLFDISRVQSELDTFLEGKKENAFPIWQWINAENWFSEFIDK